MNVRYPFLQETPAVPPLSACISSLKKHVQKPTSKSQSESTTASLFLLDSLLADMKSQLNTLKMQEMDTWDLDDPHLNSERSNFIQEQLMDARHWLEVDLELEREAKTKERNSAENHQTASTSFTSTSQEYLQPDLKYAHEIEHDELMHKVAWNNNLVADAHLPLSQNIVVFQNDAQKNGFETLEEHNSANPFEKNDVDQFVNRMQQKYGGQVDDGQEETIKSSSPDKDNMSSDYVAPQFESLPPSEAKPKSSKKQLNAHKKRRPLKKSDNFSAADSTSSTPRRNFQKKSPAVLGNSLSRHPSTTFASKRIPNKKRPASRTQEPVPPKIQQLRSIERPASRQALRPQKHIMTNNFLEETEPASPTRDHNTTEENDPFRDAPVSRSTFPKPTIDVRPHTPQTKTLYNHLDQDDDVVPPSPIEKEALRKQRPPTRKKGPPNALDLEQPIPVVQYDGMSPSGKTLTACAVQTDALEEHLKVARDFVRQQHNETGVTGEDYSTLHNTKNLVDTPTDLLRRPIRGAASFNEDDSVIVRLQDQRLEEPVSFEASKEVRASTTHNSLDRDLEQEKKNSTTAPQKSNGNTSPHKAEVRIPTPNKITPKRRASDAGLEFLTTELPSSLRRTSDSTIATSDLMSQNPFVPVDASAPFTTKSGISNDTQNHESFYKRTGRSTSVPRSRSHSATPKKHRRDGQQTSRLLSFLESPLHPKTDETQQKKKRRTRRKSVAHSERALRKPSTVTERNRRPSSAAPPALAQKRSRKSSKSHFKKPDFPSLTEEPPLPDHIHQPLQHLNPTSLRDLINLSDRLNKGKKTKKLMHLLQDVDQLYTKYHEKL